MLIFWREGGRAGERESGREGARERGRGREREGLHVEEKFVYIVYIYYVLTCISSTQMHLQRDKEATSNLTRYILQRELVTSNLTRYILQRDKEA